MTLTRNREGLILEATAPFECTTNDNRIIACSRSGTGNISVNNGSITISNCSNVFNSFNGVYINGFQQQEEDKRRHVIRGAVALNVIKVVGSCTLRILEDDMLNTQGLRLYAEGATTVYLPSSTVACLTITISGASNVSGPTTVYHLTVDSSGASKCSGLHAINTANLSVSGCSSISITSDPRCNTRESKSGCSSVTIRHT